MLLVSPFCIDKIFPCIFHFPPTLDRLNFNATFLYSFNFTRRVPTIALQAGIDVLSRRRGRQGPEFTKRLVDNIRAANWFRALTDL